MLDGKFDLRCWEFTAPQATGLTPVLGMFWERSTDSLKINLENLKHVQCECVTKKLILSVTNSVFDPLGLVSPVVLLPKLQLQKSWTLKLGWNEEVPTDIRHDFLRWLKNLNVLTNLRIPRWLMLNCGSSGQELSLHVFSDASKSAYAAVVFLRTKFSNGTEVQLVQAKSRVSPLKNMTMPRLELLAASIGVRLLLSITEVYLNCAETFFWTDSTTVLSWIKRRERWKPFVWNRVQEIRKYSKPECWFHVPGCLNSADLPTRGCDAEQLLNSRWWRGLPWLYEDRSLWPEQEYSPDEDLVIGEQRKGDISLLNSSRSDNSWVYRYFSKYHRIVRLIGWIKRFSFNCRNYSKQNDDLSVEELKQAEKLLIKIVQQETYGDAEDQISSLSPFLDEDGIIRLKTKITERDDVADFRYPAVLPSSHPVVFRLIWDTHLKNLHVGTQGVLSILRERFWIVRGRRSVKSVISKCMICQRFNSKPWDTIPVALPKDRVKEAAAFEVTGVDVFGSLLLKGNIKVWVCIFTCAVYRAIHLELMSSLSTECFLQAFRRFIARRGRPSVVYSDNARNFTGASNALNNLNWDEIERKHKIDKISWKFNVPTAAWWGGWWERLIRMCKQILRKVCGRACLNYEELSSILCDCESVMNSRPLTYLAEDQSDLATLTPAMFIQDISKAGVADLDEIESKDLNRRHRYRLRLKVELRKRFRQEYLGQLMLKKRKSCNKTLKVGDVVLVEDDTIKRIGWPLARIEQLFPGKDGVPRVAKVRTVNGSMMRPIQRLYPLEVDQDEGGGFNMKDVIKDKKETETVTRSGRVSRPPRRL